MGFKSHAQIVWEKNHVNCPHSNVADFSYYRGFETTEKTPHNYCGLCCTRWHDGKEYNPDEWDAYVNDEGDDDE